MKFAAARLLESPESFYGSETEFGRFSASHAGIYSIETLTCRRDLQKRLAEEGSRRTPSLRLPEASLAYKGSAGRAFYFTLTSICFGFASSRFGNVIVSNPSLNSARIFPGSMNAGSMNARINSPYVRSTR